MLLSYPVYNSLQFWYKLRGFNIDMLDITVLVLDNINNFNSYLSIFQINFLLWGKTVESTFMGLRKIFSVNENVFCNNVCLEAFIFMTREKWSLNFFTLDNIIEICDLKKDWVQNSKGSWGFSI